MATNYGPKQLRKLTLHAVAVTKSPSNAESVATIVRSNGGSVPTEEEFNLVRNKNTELEEALKVERALRLQREEREEKAQCVEISRGAFPLLRAKDVDSGDLLFRIRRAAKVVGDEKLETDFLALMRAGQERAKAADDLTRTYGASGTQEPSTLPAEVQQAIDPYLKECNNDVRRAVTKAATAASKAGDVATYTMLTTLKVEK